MKSASLWLEQAPPARRFGIKGPRAAQVLESQGLCVPARPNTWAPLRTQYRDDSPNVVARLGQTEFFLEEEGEAAGIAALERLGAETGAYPVLREDFALQLGGTLASAALAEVCNVEFGALPPARKPVVMTLMAGVAVLVLPQVHDAGTLYRIWCDPSFGPYLWKTLADVTTTTGRPA